MLLHHRRGLNRRIVSEGAKKAGRNIIPQATGFSPKIAKQAHDALDKDAEEPQFLAKITHYHLCNNGIKQTSERWAFG